MQASGPPLPLIHPVATIQDASRALQTIETYLRYFVGTAAEIPYGSLPVTPVAGTIRNISDSNTAVWGATAAAGGVLHVAVRYNGAAWTVTGK